MRTSLDHPRAQAAPAQPGAPPEQLGGLRWPKQPASESPKVEVAPLPPFFSSASPSLTLRRERPLFTSSPQRALNSQELRNCLNSLGLDYSSEEAHGAPPKHSAQPIHTSPEL